MKNYRQFVKDLPSSTVVFAFEEFSPPTAGHELLVKVVKKLAESCDSTHVIYASSIQDKKNPLPVEKKLHYLNSMFPGTNFRESTELLEAVQDAGRKYKNIIVVASSDQLDECTEFLNKHNGTHFKFTSIKVVSIGEPLDESKHLSYASKGLYEEFKKDLPSGLRELDSRRLMNDMRLGLGLEPIKEEINLVKDELREQYFRGKIYNVGDIVESNGQEFEIVKSLMKTL